MERSTTSIFSPAESLMPKVYHSLVKDSIFNSICRDSNTQSLAVNASFALLGNGVVIHLPGLFEEGDKNEKKGIVTKINVQNQCESK